MLVKFHSETGAVDYLESVAVALLKAMGNSGKIPGALESENVGIALSTLQKTTGNDDTGDVDDEDYVSLHKRALPLVKLMQRAIKNGEYIMWEHSS